MKRPKAGWYYFANEASFGGIEYLPDEVPSKDRGYNSYGPFKTWAAAKADAFDYYRADMLVAKMRMREVRAYKK